MVLLFEVMGSARQCQWQSVQELDVRHDSSAPSTLAGTVDRNGAECDLSALGDWADSESRIIMIHQLSI
jgi:hypothetical protein